MTGKEQTVSRYQQIESRWGYSGMSDKIRFMVDRRIYVVGFGLYGSIHGPDTYQVTIQIIHTSSERLLGSNEVSFNSDGSQSTFRVMFKEPIEVQPNTNYTASATLKVILFTNYFPSESEFPVFHTELCLKIVHQIQRQFFFFRDLIVIMEQRVCAKLWLNVLVVKMSYFSFLMLLETITERQLRTAKFQK